MPSFLHRSERYVVTTSYKVMYSTLTRQPVLEELSPRSPYVFRLWVDPRLRHFMLVRNPYARLVSFYFDKLADPRRSVGPGHRWQRCQRAFFPALGLTGTEDPAIVDERLRSLSFAAFVGLLERIAWLDEHLVPQVESRWRRLGGTRLGVRLPVHRFLKMETDRELLRSELGLDLAVHENKSAARSGDELFTPALREIVRRVYRRDFAELGYPPG